MSSHRVSPFFRSIHGHGYSWIIVRTIVASRFLKKYVLPFSLSQFIRFTTKISIYNVSKEDQFINK